MNNLFYDLEFASCKGGHKICEFGYVVTDDLFNVKEEDNLVINPNIPRNAWDYYAVKHILKKRIKEYEAGETFDKCFEKILNLFKGANRVFGHSNACDAQGLNDECIRYNKPSINHVFYDIKEIYKGLTNNHRSTSLENMIKELGIIGNQNIHDAQGDAYNTMVVLRTLVSKYNTSIDTLIKLCSSSIDESKDFLVSSIERNKKNREERELKEANCVIKGTKNYETFINFIKNVVKSSEGSGKLNGKKVCITENYEHRNLKEMINLIQLIKNEDGAYTTSAKQCDLFVCDDDINSKSKRLDCVDASNNISHNSIKKTTLSDFFKYLGTSNDELSSKELPINITLVVHGNRIRDHHHRRKPEKKNEDQNLACNQLSYLMDIDLSMFSYDDID